MKKIIILMFFFAGLFFCIIKSVAVIVPVDFTYAAAKFFGINGDEKIYDFLIYFNLMISFVLSALLTVFVYFIWSRKKI
ncbi:putative membrane protein YccC [Erwinia toletana]|uniref:Membrane protein YccC n=1 Tax=Winslowiella toletana TaxID=92490 RepID=A0ABS4PFK3_9GAMM|nr:hypothetical protein [Winslowiella toletana]MBP2170932.1 putative membrane protein YccC [Winslowiella toletana]